MTTTYLLERIELGGSQTLGIFSTLEAAQSAAPLAEEWTDETALGTDPQWNSHTSEGDYWITAYAVRGPKPRPRPVAVMVVEKPMDADGPLDVELEVLNVYRDDVEARDEMVDGATDALDNWDPDTWEPMPGGRWYRGSGGQAYWILPAEIRS